MCGIAGVISKNAAFNQHEKALHEMLSHIQHRGDKEHAYECSILAEVALGCNRLAIVDREQGQQPLTNDDGSIIVVLNGEIYNYRELYHELEAQGYRFKTQTDTEVLAHGYQEWGESLVDRLDGMFSFILYDTVQRRFLAARDHIGVKPLYYLYDQGTYYLASEIKALLPIGHSVHVLKPGHILTEGGENAYFHLSKQVLEGKTEEIIETFHELLTNAVVKMVQTDLPIGVIFSGGLDSAVVLNIARQHHPNVTAFTAGFRDSSDMKCARRFCEEYAIPQHITYLNIDTIMRSLPEAIYHAETFEAIDITDFSVIAPAMKLARDTGIKVVLGGDGSDEVLAGYEVFKRHPDPEYVMAYRLANLHRTDLQRADRCSMRYSIEARVPFVDKFFLNFAYNIPMTLKMHNGIEKWILREAFKEDLPEYITWRPKSPMAEGSGLQARLASVLQKELPTIDPQMASDLKLHSPSEAYFLETYLKLGYPLPTERYKRAALDFIEPDKLS